MVLIVVARILVGSWLICMSPVMSPGYVEDLRRLFRALDLRCVAAVVETWMDEPISCSGPPRFLFVAAGGLFDGIFSAIGLGGALTSRNNVVILDSFELRWLPTYAPRAESFKKGFFVWDAVCDVRLTEVLNRIVSSFSRIDDLLVLEVAVTVLMEPVVEHVMEPVNVAVSSSAVKEFVSSLSSASDS